MLTFQIERLADVSTEAAPLLVRHWQEIALDKDKVPLEPDWETYAVLEAKGALLITTARTENGILVGYVCDILHRALHYTSLMVAENDIFWLAPEYRKGGLGLKLLAAAETFALAAGVKKFIKHVKIHAPGPGIVLERLGYSATDTLYSKVVL